MPNKTYKIIEFVRVNILYRVEKMMFSITIDNNFLFSAWP